MTAIYLDHNASTSIAPEVASAMRDAMTGAFGNPSSTHWAGAPAKRTLETARREVSDFLGCAAEEVVFTSGGSEANNFAIKGTFFASDCPRPHFITTAVEHPATLAPLRFLEQRGASVTCLPVDATGRIDPEALRRAITADTVLITVMHANNEVGTIQPVEACAAIAREHRIRFHTDAAQSAGKIPTRVDDLGVDLLSLAGHKMYAPKGVGALYIRRGTTLEPLIHGAGHEGGRRAGTESALLAAALGQACNLAHDLSEMARTKDLRERFWAALRERFGNRAVLNGHPEERPC